MLIPRTVDTPAPSTLEWTNELWQRHHDWVDNDNVSTSEWAAFDFSECVNVQES